MFFLPFTAEPLFAEKAQNTCRGQGNSDHDAYDAGSIGAYIQCVWSHRRDDHQNDARKSSEDTNRCSSDRTNCSLAKHHDEAKIPFVLFFPYFYVTSLLKAISTEIENLWIMWITIQER